MISYFRTTTFRPNCGARLSRYSGRHTAFATEANMFTSGAIAAFTGEAGSIFPDACAAAPEARWQHSLRRDCPIFALFLPLPYPPGTLDCYPRSGVSQHNTLMFPFHSAGVQDGLEAMYGGDYERRRTPFCTETKGPAGTTYWGIQTWPHEPERVSGGAKGRGRG